MKRYPSQAAIDSRPPAISLVMSIAIHVLILAALLTWFHSPSTTQFVAAGEGEGGEGGGGSISVGVADPSSILGFARPQNVSFVGDEKNPVNNQRLETARPETKEPEEALLPPSEREKPEPDAVKTDRPVAPQQEKVFTGKEERGGSPSSSAQVGRSYGSPTPSQSVGGISLGAGGLGGGSGLPGGSAYGRIIQRILSQNYNPPAEDSAPRQEVEILLRIARDGTNLSIVNGRVAPEYILKRSSLALVNSAAERALLSIRKFPPFPADFLSTVQVAETRVRFLYPK